MRGVGAETETRNELSARCVDRVLEMTSVTGRGTGSGRKSASGRGRGRGRGRGGGGIGRAGRLGAAKQVGIGGTTINEKTEDEMLTGDTETAMGTDGVQKNLQI